MSTTEQIANLRTWVTALRSGTYKQTKGFLRQADTYCCLGVACDLFKDDSYQHWADAQSAGQHIKAFVDNGRWGNFALPPGIAEKLFGTTFDNDGSNAISTVGDQFQLPKDDDGFDVFSLAQLNDVGWSFDQIADVIERYILHLEKVNAFTEELNAQPTT